ncbi:MAG: dethiobiotin synthase [Akkermansia sp.]|nr:dethiobiotin synthase [Akkermansia sp.]
MKGLFVAGTDAGCGKTHVCTALVRAWRARGIPAVGWAPVCCGDRHEARALREAMGLPALSLDLVNPVHLRTLAAPLMAAELEGREIKIDSLVKGCRAMAEQGAPVLVDSCGCWATPLASGVIMGDLALALQLPVLLVASNRLGAAGQVAMAVNAMRLAGAECCGVVLNSTSEEWDTACVTNAGLIERCTGVPVLAQLIAGQDELDAAAFEPLCGM